MSRDGFLFSIDNKLNTSVYDKRDNFNFYIVKFPHNMIATSQTIKHMESIFHNLLQYVEYVIPLLTSINDMLHLNQESKNKATDNMIGYVSCSKSSGNVIREWFVYMM